MCSAGSCRPPSRRPARGAPDEDSISACPGCTLAWTAAGFAAASFLMIARASFLGAAGFSAATQTVVFGTLGLGILSGTKQDIRARGEASRAPAPRPRGSRRASRPWPSRSDSSRAPIPRTAGVLIPQCLPYWSLGFLAAAALSVRAYGTLRRSRAGSLPFALPALAAVRTGGDPRVPDPRGSTGRGTGFPPGVRGRRQVRARTC
ncbi:MAG: hypothetical protein M0C28_30485 [Candidatus Moduliflexus flocculans]|nr:hypothetical protein [Candidatus Moduliflexus flocculans]